MHSSDCWPAFSQASRLTLPCSRQSSTCGATSLLTKRRTLSRKVSWSLSKIVRLLVITWLST